VSGIAPAFIPFAFRVMILGKWCPDLSFTLILTGSSPGDKIPLMDAKITTDPGPEENARGFDGPYLFCDYWASVLNLQDIVNLGSLSTAGLSLEIFRKILNRPSAGLPRLGYYILYSILKPFILIYQGAMKLVGRRRCKADTSYKRDAMQNLLLDHALRIDPKEGGRADIYFDGELVAPGVVNPLRLRASASLFFGRYKVFLASAVALGYGALVEPVASLFGAENVLVPYLGVLFYPIVFVILWLLFNDILTAVVAPLPLIAITRIVHISQGFKGFVLAVALTAVVLYLVEWFFIPRSLPPALYLYVNDAKNKLFPYKAGHEPYWLEGKFYWVWRYVTLAPAELLKFWEKDWERLEIWVRADGEERGRIEWVVTDWHYRELWYKYDAFTGDRARAVHDKFLNRSVDTPEKLTWVVDLDMDLVFHCPVIRGIYLAEGNRLSIWRRALSILNVMIRNRHRENPEKYAQKLEEFEIQGGEFLDDMPEAFRMAMGSKLLSWPWTYWRFPRGAKAARSDFLYGSHAGISNDPEPASDKRLQIKEPSD